MQDTFVISQVQTFALTVGLGLLIGFGYDMLRAVKKFTRPSRTILFFADLFFWIVMTAVVFFALLSNNWGEVRAYVFIGLATGGLFYTLTLSRPIYRLLITVLAFIQKICLTVARPFIYLAGKIGRAAKRGHRFAARMEKTFVGGTKRRIEKIPKKFSRKKKE